MRELSEAQKVMRKKVARPKPPVLPLWMGTAVFIAALALAPKSFVIMLGATIIILMPIYMIGVGWNVLGPQGIRHALLKYARLMMGLHTCNWCGASLSKKRFETHKCTTMTALSRLQTIMPSSTPNQGEC